ncbi:hypothetical protein [Ramlibacter sp.]|uniref:hypothetical protein n=1 Tax=Ramlibacter sp. TaxID=1917967 RepID=UPI002638542B|nr:hypothetical protein [Ramlibacter sp.]MDB5956549.1 hypothetical protein [Ramlibacter sp.]
MSISQGAALSAIAFQFAAALEVYDQEADRLVQAHGDLGIYQALGVRMDEMRRYATALPDCAGPWVEVLIRHFELTHTLWHVQQGKAVYRDLQTVRHAHAGAVQFLSQRLVHLLPRH